jgi:hypothetical protein
VEANKAPGNKTRSEKCRGTHRTAQEDECLPLKYSLVKEAITLW